MQPPSIILPPHPVNMQREMIEDADGPDYYLPESQNHHDDTGGRGSSSRSRAKAQRYKPYDKQQTKKPTKATLRLVNSSTPPTKNDDNEPTTEERVDAVNQIQSHIEMCKVMLKHEVERNVKLLEEHSRLNKIVTQQQKLIDDYHYKEMERLKEHCQPKWMRCKTKNKDHLFVRKEGDFCIYCNVSKEQLSSLEKAWNDRHGIQNNKQAIDDAKEDHQQKNNNNILLMSTEDSNQPTNRKDSVAAIDAVADHVVTGGDKVVIVDHDYPVD